MTRLLIRSGGQSGVDRAALDVAIELGIPYCGWCPSGGWAEDFAVPPGVLSVYPRLQETPSADPQQRTAWNVRDCDATLILTPDSTFARSPGTQFTRVCAELIFLKPWRVGDPNDERSGEGLASWLHALAKQPGDASFCLNVAGPRESEVPGIYDQSRRYLRRLLETGE